MTCVPQIITYTVSEKGMEHKEEKRYVSFGRTTMQALELLWLTKRHISEQSDVD